MATTAAQSAYMDQSAFHYDYESLRTTGVILAVVMFVAGILIALTQVPLRAPSQQRQKCPLRRCDESGVLAREEATGCQSHARATKLTSWCFRTTFTGWRPISCKPVSVLLRETVSQLDLWFLLMRHCSGYYRCHSTVLIRAFKKCVTKGNG
ncbi:FXYD domain containing ion transport regulator 7 isoform X1 [Scleropages formosus]|uniref:FXYD domain containing ion transport regulator 7 isoform X1 n=1 Tax=Scleropages formosus TaxID=113540 RepID=UPI0008786DC0|nr:uncharacterized protein LOC108930338 isoform X1 [Scleropages formosus]